jgi:hypothetical protein
MENFNSQMYNTVGFKSNRTPAYSKNSITQRFTNFDTKNIIAMTDMQANTGAIMEAMSERLKNSQIQGASTQKSSMEPPLSFRNQQNATQNHSLMSKTLH